MPRISYDEVKRFIEAVDYDRRDRLREAGLNAEFYRGHGGRHYDHWVGYKDLRRYKRPRKWQDEVRWTSYLATSTVQRVTAAVGRTPVAFYGVPASNDISHRASAHFSTQWINYLRYADNLVAFRELATFLIQIDPMICIKVGFDDLLGDPITLPEELRNLLNPKIRRRNVFTGASWWDIVRYNNLYYFPWVSSLDDSAIIVEESYETNGALLQMFPGNRVVRDMAKGKIAPLSPTDNTSRRNRSLYNRQTDEIFDEHLRRLWTVWVPPGAAFGQRDNGSLREFPDGWIEFFVDDRFILEGRNPLSAFGLPHPYEPMTEDLDPKNHYIESVPRMTRLRSQIPVVEAVMNTVVEQQLFSTNPVRLYPEGSIDINKYANPPPGSWVPFTTIGAGAGRPSVMETQGLHPSGMHLLNLMMDMTMDDGGIRDAARGGVPPRVESGEAIKVVLEQDLARTTNVHANVDRVFSKVLWKRLVLEANLSIGSRRLYTVVGRSGIPDAFDWHGAGMAGTAGVHHVSSPTISYSPTAEDQRTLSLFDRGLISFQETQDRMHMLSPDSSITGLRDQHMALARHENRLLASGENVATLEGFDHGAHKHVHMVFLLQYWWELSDEQKVAFVEHIENHDAYEALLVVSQLNQMKAMSGIQAA